MVWWPTTKREQIHKPSKELSSLVVVVLLLLLVLLLSGESGRGEGRGSTLCCSREGAPWEPRSDPKGSEDCW